MDNHKRKLILWAVIATLIIGLGLLIWLLARQPKEEGPNITVTTDPDTGDEIINVQGKEAEFDPDPGPTIFGGAKFLDKTTVTDTQYELIISILTDYAHEHVGQEVTAIKLLPETVETIAYTPAGIPYQYKLQIKTDNPVVLLNATVNLVGLDRVRMIITNTDNPAVGAFDSGIQPSSSHGSTDEGDH